MAYVHPRNRTYWPPRRRGVRGGRQQPTFRSESEEWPTIDQSNALQSNNSDGAESPRVNAPTRPRGPQLPAHRRSESTGLSPNTKAKTWKSPEQAEKENFERLDKLTKYFCPKSPFVAKTFPEWLAHVEAMRQAEKIKLIKTIERKTASKSASRVVPAIPAFLENPAFFDGRSTVLYERTIWSVEPLREEAPWPCGDELRTDGPNRLKSSPKFGRFLPTPRKASSSEAPSTGAVAQRTVGEKLTTPAVTSVTENTQQRQTLKPLSDFDVVGPLAIDKTIRPIFLEYRLGGLVRSFWDPITDRAVGFIDQLEKDMV